MLFSNTNVEKPLYFFEKISMIPRESGHEEAISDAILAWAKGLGLEAHQSECGNLIIKKPASAGLEDHAPVILQAHMDMVCEKNSDSDHDFAKDPILLKKDGNWLIAANGTTLGADDGIGVAYCLAVLEDKTLVHPPIEVLLTVEEESTFNGAEHVDWSLLEGRALINLDSSIEDEVLVSSAGGSGIQLESGLDHETVEAPCEVYRVSISGLKGGHSGEDIHRGHGSANRMLMRILRRLLDSADISLRYAEGGTSRLAISREANAEFLFAPSKQVPNAADARASLFEAFESAKAQILEEYAAATPEIKIALEKTEDDTENRLAMTYKSFLKVLQVFQLLPDGIQSMSGVFLGNVESSINLGILRADADHLTVVAEARGGHPGSIEEICARVKLVADTCGCSYDFFNRYMPWAYQPDSPLRALVMSTYEDLFAKPMRAVSVHAGIECGCFLQDVPALDAISIGPNCKYFHSPQERMNITSALHIWELLKTMLSRM